MSDLPYPEAPLASRKATSSERGGEVSQASDAGLLRRAERREAAGAGNEPGTSSRSEEFSTVAENQAEALAIERHQERKHGLSERDVRSGDESGSGATSSQDARGRKAPARSERSDFKKPPRYIDPEVLRAFHDGAPSCLSCGYYSAHAHHLVSRAQAGDDVQANLLALCGVCHHVLHSGGAAHIYGATQTQEGVRNRIGAFLTSEAGEDHLNYVKRKLGTGAGAFLERYGVEL